MQYIRHRHSMRGLWFGSATKREQSGKLLSCKLTSIQKKNTRLLFFSSLVLSLILIIHVKQEVSYIAVLGINYVLFLFLVLKRSGLLYEREDIFYEWNTLFRNKQRLFTSYFMDQAFIYFCLST